MHPKKGGGADFGVARRGDERPGQELGVGESERRSRHRPGDEGREGWRGVGARPSVEEVAKRHEILLASTLPPANGATPGVARIRLHPRRLAAETTRRSALPLPIFQKLRGVG